MGSILKPLIKNRSEPKRNYVEIFRYLDPQNDVVNDGLLGSVDWAIFLRTPYLIMGSIRVPKEPQHGTMGGGISGLQVYEVKPGTSILALTLYTRHVNLNQSCC